MMKYKNKMEILHFVATEKVIYKMLCFSSN